MTERERFFDVLQSEWIPLLRARYLIDTYLDHRRPRFETRHERVPGFSPAVLAVVACTQNGGDEA